MAAAALLAVPGIDLSVGEAASLGDFGILLCFGVLAGVFVWLIRK